MNSRARVESWIFICLFGILPFAVPFWTITGRTDQYSEVRWFLLFVSVLGMLLLSFFRSASGAYGRTLPDPGRGRLPYGLALIAALGSAVACAIGFPGSLELYLLSLGIYLILFLSAYRLALLQEEAGALFRRIADANLFGLSVAVAYLGLQKAGIFWEILAVRPGETLSFFGNKNYAGSFYATSLLIHLFYFERGPGRWRRVLFAAGLLFGAFGLMEMRARGATLGLFAGLGLYGWRRVPLAGLKKRLAAWGVGALVLGITVFYSYRGVAPESDTRAIRLMRWGNTVQMIREHPWGVGPGRFEWDYYQYARAPFDDWEISERGATETPHNLVLEVASEHGIPAVLALLSLVILVLGLAYRTRPGAVSILAAFLVDGFFSFPLKLPYQFLVFSFFSGVAVAAAVPPRVPARGRSLLLVKSVVFLALSGLGFLHFSAIWAESISSQRYDTMETACLRAPWRIRNCLSLAMIELGQRRLDAAEQTCLDMLERQPHMVPALGALAMVQEAQGKKEARCATLRKFDGYFRGLSSAHPLILKECLGSAPR